VDDLAADVVGSLVVEHPGLADAVLDRWIRDDDFWIRRSALLALLGPLRRGGGDWERFARYADEVLDEKEFFIRKAIGWVLRETAKKRPALVVDWVAARTDRISGVTIREAVRYVDPADRDALMAAYRARTAASRRHGR
jgi:3-methyladenine DNA glycosylase AlkD